MTDNDTLPTPPAAPPCACEERHCNCDEHDRDREHEEHDTCP
jgi:hypothetical protein